MAQANYDVELLGRTSAQSAWRISSPKRSASQPYRRLGSPITSSRLTSCISHTTGRRKCLPYRTRSH
eukprot:1828101-Prorocentrum_lima.AAC.1